MSGRPSNDVAWLAEVQRPPDRVPDSMPAPMPALQPLLTDGDGNPIDSLPEWQAKRAEIRRWWLDFLSPVSCLPSRVPTLEILGEECLGAITRQRVRYEVEPGSVTEAYLLKPTTPRTTAQDCPSLDSPSLDSLLPGVVVFHSTVDESIDEPSGVVGPSPKNLGWGLAQRGFVALCPRNFLWPNNHRLSPRWQTFKQRCRHPRRKGMAKMLLDAFVAVNILSSLPEVDSDRLGTVGHSLGAKEALYLAALDERIRVAASHEGGVGIRFSNWDAPWYLGRQVRRGTFRREHHELMGLIAPRAFLLLGGDGFDGVQSWPFVEAVLPVYKLYETPARVGLYNHHQGHKFTTEAEQRIYEWFEAYG
ncbi:MAG: dienelactone hydrolase family protein [Thermoguttaceae bacterium]